MLDFNMGAYGAYVWPAWGISVLVLAALVARTALAARRWKAELKRLEADNAPQGARSAAGRQK